MNAFGLEPYRLLSALTVMIALWGCGRGELEAARHVVLISMDTTRADHFGFYGNSWVQTPRLDAFAQESVVFTDSVSVAPTTLASHTSLLTGKHPHHHGIPRNGFLVSFDNEMLPELLGAAGFHTAGFIGSFALDRRFQFAQGFDHYDQRFDTFVGEGGADQDQRSAEAVTDAVLEYLEAQGAPDRLFLFVHYFDPHRPYAAPPPFDTAYDPRGREGLLPVNKLKGNTELSGEERQQVLERYPLQYASEISYMDAHIGRLLDGLAQRRILDEALVILTSDHGENLLDHERHFSHGRSVYGSTMRSVWVMRLPRAELGGTRVDRPVSTIDVLPTVLTHLGRRVPAGVRGSAVSLDALDTSPPPMSRFGQATKPWKRVETDPRWPNMRKARYVLRGDHKFIQTPFLGTEELYDLSRDPGETQNLLPDGTAEVRKLAAGLRDELEAWAASADPLPSEFDPTRTNDTIERLRSLGYLGGP